MFDAVTVHRAGAGHRIFCGASGLTIPLVRRLRPADAVLTVSVALVYVATARLGLALAVHADQVSAVWPPTGIALATVLRFGLRAVPGVLIGAFAANASV